MKVFCFHSCIKFKQRQRETERLPFNTKASLLKESILILKSPLQNLRQKHDIKSGASF